MKLTELVTDSLVELNLRGHSKDEVITEMIRMLDGAGAIQDTETFRAAIYDRENHGSTGIGMGIAIPHGKSDSVKSPRVAFGIKAEGVDWDSLDGELAKLIFMIAVPESNAGNEHLKILQMLSRKLIDDSFREALLQVNSHEEALKLFDAIV